MRLAVTYPGCHRRGGVERVMLECVNFLATRGHEIHALAREWDEAAVDPGVVRHQLSYVHLTPALGLPAYRRSVTAAVTHLEPCPDVVAGFGAGAPPGSVVWMQSVHAAWIEMARATRGPGGRLRQRLNPFHPVALAMERRQLTRREYRSLIALTPDVKADIVRFYGVPAEDVHVLPNGFSQREFHPRSPEERVETRARLGFADDDVVIVFVANELERKGFAQLVEAISRLRDPSVRLLAVGGFRQSEARALVSRAGLEGRVVLHGATSEVAGLYAAADVFALPTKYEAWGLVIVEAMACGLPVLTTRLAGAAVTVRHGETGYLVDDPADVQEIASGLEHLLRGPMPSPQEIAASVARYEWGSLLVRYEEILRQAAGD